MVHVAHQSSVELLAYGAVPTLHTSAQSHHSGLGLAILHACCVKLEQDIGRRSLLTCSVVHTVTNTTCHRHRCYLLCVKKIQSSHLRLYRPKISCERTTMKTFCALLFSSVSVICYTFTSGKVETLYLEVCPATWSTFVLGFV